MDYKWERSDAGESARDVVIVDTRHNGDITKKVCGELSQLVTFEIHCEDQSHNDKTDMEVKK